MAKANGKKQTDQRYTNRLKNQEQRQAVLGIQARSADNKFRTRVFKAELSKNAFTLEYRWREAWRNPDTHIWSVVECAGIRSKPSDPHPFNLKKRTVLEKACFFDALHNCAEFEQGEQGLKRAPVTDNKQNLPDMHYTDMAQQENQPFNEQSLPVPAINGQIVIDGTFSMEAYETAEKTRGIFPAIPDALKPGGTTQPSQMNEALFTNAVDSLQQQAIVRKASAGVIRQKKENSAALVKKVAHHTDQFDKALTSLQKLNVTFKLAAEKAEDIDSHKKAIKEGRDWALKKRKFKGEHAIDCVLPLGLFSWGATLFGIGVGTLAFTPSVMPLGEAAATALWAAPVPLASYMISHKTNLFQNTTMYYRKAKAILGTNISTGWKKMRALRQFKKDVKGLPESRYKDALQHFGKDVEVGFQALEAEQAARQIKEDPSSAPKAKRLLKKTFVMAEKQGLDDNMIGALDKALNKDWSTEEPDNGLSEEIRKKTNELSSVWTQAKEHIKTELEEHYKHPEQKTLPSEGAQLLLGPKIS